MLFTKKNIEKENIVAKIQPNIKTEPKISPVSHTKPIDPSDFSEETFKIPVDLKDTIDVCMSLNMPSQAILHYNKFHNSQMQKAGYIPFDIDKFFSGYNGVFRRTLSSNSVDFYINLLPSDIKHIVEIPRMLYIVDFNTNKSHNWFIAPLDYLKKPVPYGLLLRMDEIKKLNLFNYFVVLAPEECFGQDARIDPVILGVITIDGSPDSSTYYYIGEWE